MLSCGGGDHAAVMRRRGCCGEGKLNAAVMRRIGRYCDEEEEDAVCRDEGEMMLL
jgi:hypothetical protein